MHPQYARVAEMVKKCHNALGVAVVTMDGRSLLPTTAWESKGWKLVGLKTVQIRGTDIGKKAVGRLLAATREDRRLRSRRAVCWSVVNDEGSTELGVAVLTKKGPLWAAKGFEVVGLLEEVTCG